METITLNGRAFRVISRPSAKPRKRSKYGNRHVIVGSEHFDSMAEAKRHQELKFLEKAGAIVDLKRQVTFHLLVNGKKVCGIRPDWTYTMKTTGQKVAEDKKGYQDKAHKIRWKLAKALHPEIEWRLS